MAAMSQSAPVLVLHGGAGTINRGGMTPEREAAYHVGIRGALAAGHAVLSAGGTALDAVVATVMALEDDPLFNAGRGAVYTTAETHEMDAAVMDGQDRRAGAVAGVCGPRHPVLAARAVMEHSAHVFLAGAGAVDFCRDVGLEFADPQWFGTERRLQALRQEMQRRASGAADNRDDSDKHGTVGAVARDAHGNLAAATSTGGITAKMPGRVGDSPVIGAGTWADNATCAISCTGQGEFFIRYGAGHEIDARMRWAGQSLDQASSDVIHQVLAPIGGDGGLIAVDAQGQIALPFNSSGMYRGFVRCDDGLAHSAIYREDYQVAPL